LLFVRAFYFFFNFQSNAMWERWSYSWHLGVLNVKNLFIEFFISSSSFFDFVKNETRWKLYMKGSSKFEMIFIIISVNSRKIKCQGSFMTQGKCLNYFQLIFVSLLWFGCYVKICIGIVHLLCNALQRGRGVWNLWQMGRGSKTMA